MEYLNIPKPVWPYLNSRSLRLAFCRAPPFAARVLPFAESATKVLPSSTIAFLAASASRSLNILSAYSSLKSLLKLFCKGLSYKRLTCRLSGATLRTSPRTAISEQLSVSHLKLLETKHFFPEKIQLNASFNHFFKRFQCFRTARRTGYQHEVSRFVCVLFVFENFDSKLEFARMPAVASTFRTGAFVQWPFGGRSSVDHRAILGRLSAANVCTVVDSCALHINSIPSIAVCNPTWPVGYADRWFNHPSQLFSSVFALLIRSKWALKRIQILGEIPVTADRPTRRWSSTFATSVFEQNEISQLFLSSSTRSVVEYFQSKELKNCKITNLLQKSTWLSGQRDNEESSEKGLSRDPMKWKVFEGKIIWNYWKSLETIWNQLKSLEMQLAIRVARWTK